MFPLMLADLTAGELAKKNVTTLSREIVLMRFRHSADSSIIAGLRLAKTGAEQRAQVMTDSSARGWQMADYWKRRYKKASTERWLWRGAAALGIYVKVKGL